MKKKRNGAMAADVAAREGDRATGAEQKLQKPKAPPAGRQIAMIGRRDWSLIRYSWLDSPPMWSAETPLIGDAYNPPAMLEAKRMFGDDHVFRATVPGIRAATIDSAMVDLFKAANVIGCSETQTKSHPTWAIAVAYQGAFFALDAAIKLLGVCAFEVENTTLIVDMFPPPPESLSAKMRQNYVVGEQQLLLRSAGLNHYDKWALLLRILRVTVNEPIPNDLYDELVRIDDRTFAKQRNHLHYRSTWIFGDLLTLLSLPEIATFRTFGELLSSMRNEEENFTIAIAFTVLAICMFLLKDLASISEAFALCYETLRMQLNREQHPYYSELFSEQLLPEYERTIQARGYRT